MKYVVNSEKRAHGEYWQIDFTKLLCNSFPKAILSNCFRGLKYWLVIVDTFTGWPFHVAQIKQGSGENIIEIIFFQDLEYA